MAPQTVSLSLLLPPSEGKAESGASRSAWQPDSGLFGASLGARRLEIATALAALGGGGEKLLGVGGKHLDRAQSANLVLVGAPCLPAAARYTGVVWDGLGIATMDPAVRRRANASVVVISGLLGVVGLNDPTPDYRIKIGASLPTLGKLSTWWRPAISATIDSWAAKRFVVDLLPQEHRAAWTPGSGLRGVTVGFVERSGKVAGHDAKAAKGRLARHLLESPGHPLAALEAWVDDRFDLTITPL